MENVFEHVAEIAHGLVVVHAEQELQFRHRKTIAILRVALMSLIKLRSANKRNRKHGEGIKETTDEHR